MASKGSRSNGAGVTTSIADSLPRCSTASILARWMARSSPSRRVAGQELFRVAPAVGADREQVGASNADQLMHVACHRLGFDMKQFRAGARLVPQGAEPLRRSPAVELDRRVPIRVPI
jgi:hypothetical protein